MNQQNIPICTEFVATRLTRKFLLCLPKGAYVTSNCAVPFSERIGPVDTRLAAWQRARTSGAAGRLCHAGWTKTSGTDPGPDFGPISHMVLVDAMYGPLEPTKVPDYKLSGGEDVTWARPIHKSLTLRLLKRLPSGAYVGSNVGDFALRLGSATTRGSDWERIKAARADGRKSWVCWRIDGGPAPGLAAEESRDQLTGGHVMLLWIEVVTRTRHSNDVLFPPAHVQDSAPELNG